jgi:hypothetical protein
MAQKDPEKKIPLTAANAIMHSRKAGSSSVAPFKGPLHFALDAQDGFDCSK